MRNSYKLKKLSKYLKFNKKIQDKDLNFKHFENFPYLNVKRTSDQELKSFSRIQVKIKKYIFNYSKDIDYHFFRRLDIILLFSSFANSIYQARQWIKHKLVLINNTAVYNYNQQISNNTFIQLHPKLSEIIHDNLVHKKNQILLILEQDKKIKESTHMCINSFIFGTTFLQVCFRTLSLKVIYY
jgi:ribosomal protein S4|uniref:Ribosomal protein S4 n=1 Tax=Cyanidiaceae sp. MX-AZ01 TaxID=1503164 RepID=A0A060A4P4_9RHOD|nr:ribosomal protein S4 [Cyanidiaceae sp. MX-AZ01]